jgi:P27 family predicted phage terminase small subunit
VARGRKAAAPKLKLLKSDQPCRLNKAPAGVNPGRPVPPDHFDAPVKAEWNRLCDRLEAMQVLDISHGFALAIYCSAYSRLLAAQLDLKNNGMLISSGGETRTLQNGVTIEKAGARKTNPSARIASQAEAMMFRVLTDFGLTAVSSSKVSASTPKEDEFDAFLKKKSKG